MKLLIISDIHACQDSPPNGLKRSYVTVGESAATSIAETFLKFIENNPSFLPDVVICPGDLGDRANSAGTHYAWNFLVRLAQTNPSSVLFATAGNHDLDSRFQKAPFDPKGVLQGLLPEFPLVGPKEILTPEFIERANLEFWARNFFFAYKENIRFVVLNSCAFHGYGSDNETKEYEHGRISTATLDRLKARIIADDKKRQEGQENPVELNILICHHHLQTDGPTETPANDQIIGGHQLIEFLSDTTYGRWLVIHGHRHRARILQPPGSSGPFTLSAASFGATHDGDYGGNTTPNQVHLVELDVQKMKAVDFMPSGHIKSVTYTPGVGWLHTKGQNGGLPPHTGFGFRGSLDQLATQIIQELNNSNKAMEWGDLMSAIQNLEYVDYLQLQELEKTLGKRGVNVTFDVDKKPLFVGRKP